MKNGILKELTKAFIIVGIVLGFPLILPIIFGILALKKIDDLNTNKNDLLVWGILTLIFVNLVSGIVMIIESTQNSKNDLSQKTESPDEQKTEI
ncbi:hypothetical protein R9B83_02765 [Metamycoplasma equirhinis]|uniref:Uncharacterized protein n=1 Tax=Metamycoplasma equirhinis TaxID=92402 RepID=A0ABZ0PAG3_9BACT|nr:hypothetical protein [Metamycoplasma equirhinis]TPD99566.1 hypothetical protein FJM08_00105 [Metamycoplasma equirhinis]WPB53885.1 hypothetical protein R9B83_02765 [Metamycoplasma equirhinis]